MDNKSIYKKRGRALAKRMKAIYAFIYNANGNPNTTFGQYLASIGTTEREFLSSVPPQLSVAGIADATRDSDALAAFAEALYAYYANQLYLFMSSDGDEKSFSAEGHVGANNNQDLWSAVIDPDGGWYNSGGGPPTMKGSRAIANKFRGIAQTIQSANQMFARSLIYSRVNGGNSYAAEGDAQTQPEGSADYIILARGKGGDDEIPVVAPVQVSPAHIEIQRRINWFLRDGFGPVSVVEHKQPDGQWKQLTDAELQQYISEHPNEVHSAFLIGRPFWKSPSGKIYFFKNRNDWRSKTAGNWKSVDWMHWRDAENAAQGIFDMATGKNTGGGQAPLNPGDTWQNYDYPESGLAYFVRCPPKNLTCQLGGKKLYQKLHDVNIGDVAHVLNKYNPATVIARGAFSSLLAINAFKLAANLWKIYDNRGKINQWNKFMKTWKAVGGEEKELVAVLMIGKDKPAIFSADGHYNSDGGVAEYVVAAAALIAAAKSIITDGKAALKEAGVIDDKEAAESSGPDIPPGATIIPGSNPPLPSTGDAQVDAALLEAQRDGSGGGDIGGGNFFSKYKVYIIGGVLFVVLLGVFIAIGSKSKQ